MENYSVIKENKLLIYPTIWMDLKRLMKISLMLFEKRQFKSDVLLRPRSRGKVPCWHTHAPKCCLACPSGKLFVCLSLSVVFSFKLISTMYGVISTFCHFSLKKHIHL